MAKRCPVVGCNQSGFRFFGQGTAQVAADISLMFPSLERLIEISDQPSEPSRVLSFDPGEVRALLTRGREMSIVLHREAHGESTPGSKEPKAPDLKVWYQQVGKMDEIVLGLDPEWYKKYWEGVFHSDHKLPRAARKRLRRLGLI